MLLAKKVLYKIKSKLSNKLILLFLGMIFLIVGITISVIYVWMVNKMTENYKDNSFTKLEQYGHNIDLTCSNIEMILKQIFTNTYNSIEKLDSLNMKDKGYNIEETKLFMGLADSIYKSIISHAYINSVIYYREDGVGLKVTQNQNITYHSNDYTTDRFFSSEFNEIFRREEKGNIWFGIYTTKDFGIPVLVNEPDTPVITLTFPFYAKSNKYLIVININMKYFTQIYGYAIQSDIEDIFIVDSDNKVVADDEFSNLGKHKLTNIKISNSNNYVVSNETDSIGKKHIMIHKLSVSDWYLVNILPDKIIRQQINSIKYILFAILFISNTASAVLIKFWIFRIIKPLNVLKNAMIKTEQGNLELQLPVVSKDEIGILTHQFNLMNASILKLVETNKIKEEEVRINEMKILRAQINPHFIYNTLNVIRWMAIIQDAKNIEDCVSALSDFLHPIFKSINFIVTLEEEIKYIDCYIKIMNYRFGDRYKVRYNIADELKGNLVLRFILQPIVENSIAHGLSNRNNGLITIRSYIESEYIWITVKDDGIGIDKDELDALNENFKNVNLHNSHSVSSIGLDNVNRRIKLHYGNEYGLSIKSIKNSGTCVYMKFPLTKVCKGEP